MGFKDIRGYPRKKAPVPRPLDDFLGALGTLWKRVKKAGKGRRGPVSGGGGWTPLGPPFVTHPFFSGVFSGTFLGGRFLSGAGAGGNCARPTRLPDPSPVLDKNRAPMGP